MPLGFFVGCLFPDGPDPCALWPWALGGVAHTAGGAPFPSAPTPSPAVQGTASKGPSWSTGPSDVRERPRGRGWPVLSAAGAEDRRTPCSRAGLQACQLALSTRTVWARCPNGDLARRYGVTDKNPAGDYWKKIPGNVTCFTGKCQGSARLGAAWLSSGSGLPWARSVGPPQEAAPTGLALQIAEGHTRRRASRTPLARVSQDRGHPL